MLRSFKTQLAGQIGESLVVAELGRRGIVATAFSGNVPDIDLLAYANQKTCHLQVKAWRKGSIHFDAKRFISIQFDGDRQIVGGLDQDIDGQLIYVFVKIGSEQGEDRFFILEQKNLQKVIADNYAGWLDKHGGIRPRNPKTTHCAVYEEQLASYEGNWALIEARFEDPHVT